MGLYLVTMLTKKQLNGEVELNKDTVSGFRSRSTNQGYREW
jgi:hypothetical protein